MVLALDKADWFDAAAIPPAIGRPSSTLMACYAKILSVSSFLASRVSNCPPGPASIANASYGCSHRPSFLASGVYNHRPGPASITNASYGGSHCPDPDGFHHSAPVDVYCLHHGGYSSQSFRGYNIPPQVYPPVSPLHHGGLSISLACPAYGGFPSIRATQVHCHPHGGIGYHAN